MYKARINKVINKIETNGQIKSQFTHDDENRKFTAQVCKQEKGGYKINVKSLVGYDKKQLETHLNNSLKSLILKEGDEIFLLQQDYKNKTSSNQPPCTPLACSPKDKYRGKNDNSPICEGDEALKLNINCTLQYVNTSLEKCDENATTVTDYFVYKIISVQ